MRKWKDTAITKDIETYFNALLQNNTSLCLNIERRYGLDGYPPNIVIAALQAKEEGKNMYKFIDKMMGC